MQSHLPCSLHYKLFQGQSGPEKFRTVVMDYVATTSELKEGQYQEAGEKSLQLH